ncbi:MAG: hypothetical protein ACK6DC_10990 [Planctomycetota bacterium]
MTIRVNRPNKVACRRAFFLIACLLCSIIIAGSLFPVGAIAQSPPVKIATSEHAMDKEHIVLGDGLSSDESEVDIGERVSELKHRFSIAFAGIDRRRMEVLEIKSSCGCLVSSVEPASEETAQLAIDVNIVPSLGDFERKLEIRYRGIEEGGAVRSKILKIRGQGYPILVASPEVVTLRDEPYPRKVEFAVVVDDRFSVDIDKCVLSLPEYCGEKQVKYSDRSNQLVVSFLLNESPPSGFACRVDCSGMSKKSGLAWSNGVNMRIDLHRDRLVPNEIIFLPKSDDQDSFAGWKSSFVLVAGEKLNRKFRIAFRDDTGSLVYLNARELVVDTGASNGKRVPIRVAVLPATRNVQTFNHILIEFDDLSVIESACKFLGPNTEK